MTDTTLPPDGTTGDRTEPVDIQQEMQNSYIDYAMSVIVGRALPEVLAELGANHGVTNVLVEGGGQVLGAFFEAGLVDEVCFYVAPRICGGPDFALGRVELGAGPVELERVEYKKLGRDLRMTGLVRRRLLG